MKKILIALISWISLTTLNYACCNEQRYTSWTVDGAFGMAFYPNMANHDGQSAMGRLSLGYALFSDIDAQLNLEAGIQSGNTMRLLLPKESIDVLGGLPIDAKMKPMLDILISANILPWSNPFMMWLKGGIAYRELQLDRDSVPDLSQFSPEIQVGFGYQINQQAAIKLGYQYIFGKKSILTVNPLAEEGVLHNIPMQQAGMIGVSFNF